jgi:hypothetical protein
VVKTSDKNRTFDYDASTSTQKINLGFDQFPKTSSETTGVGSATNTPNSQIYWSSYSSSDMPYFYYSDWIINANNEDKCGIVTCTYHEVGCLTPITNEKTSSESMHFLTSYISNVAITADPRAS